MKKIWCDKCGRNVGRDFGLLGGGPVVEGGKEFDLCWDCHLAFNRLGLALLDELSKKRLDWLESCKQEIEFTPPKDKKAYLHEGVKTNPCSFGFVDHD